MLNHEIFHRNKNESEKSVCQIKCYKYETAFYVTNVKRTSIFRTTCMLYASCFDRFHSSYSESTTHIMCSDAIHFVAGYVYTCPPFLFKWITVDFCCITLIRSEHNISSKFHWNVRSVCLIICNVKNVSNKFDHNITGLVSLSSCIHFNIVKEFGANQTTKVTRELCSKFLEFSSWLFGRAPVNCDRYYTCHLQLKQSIFVHLVSAVW